MLLRIALIFKVLIIRSYLKIAELLSLWLLIVIASFVSSCKKSPLNPYCWGNLEKTLLVIPPPSVCAHYVILESTRQWYVISNDLPKDFENDPRDTIPVLINYKFVEGKLRVPPCSTEKEVKIRGIREQ